MLTPPFITPIEFDLPGPPATDQLGYTLGVRFLAQARDRPGEGALIYFHGDLGAGKTSLVRACLQAMGVTGRIKSPTYTLCEPYRVALAPSSQSVTNRLELKANSSLYLYHFDFYRFADPTEWEQAGFREHFSGAEWCFVEWPERAAGLLPSADCKVELSLPNDLGGAGRQVRLTAGTAKGQALIQGLTL